MAENVNNAGNPVPAQPPTPPTPPPVPAQPPAQAAAQQVSQPTGMEAQGVHTAAQAASGVPEQAVAQAGYQQNVAPSSPMPYAQQAGMPNNQQQVVAASAAAPAVAAAPASLPSESSSQANSFFAKLFDLSFTRYASPTIAKVAYILSLVAIWGTWLVLSIATQRMSAAVSDAQSVLGEWVGEDVSATSSSGSGLFFVVFLFGAVVAVWATLIVRMKIESWVAAVRTAENTRDMRNALSS